MLTLPEPTPDTFHAANAAKMGERLLPHLEWEVCSTASGSFARGAMSDPNGEVAVHIHEASASVYVRVYVRDGVDEVRVNRPSVWAALKVAVLIAHASAVFAPLVSPQAGSTNSPSPGNTGS